jgi:Flp pilus assembly protein TadG
MSRDLQPDTTDGRRSRWRDDRGSESVELAILLPVGLLLVAMLVVGGRIALAGDRISGVAGIAARDASLARSAAGAQQIATDTVTTALTSRGLHCVDVVVSVDTSGFSAPPGTSASVTVAVSCTVDLSDIGGVAGLPGSRTLQDSATSPLDPARDLS